MRGDKIGMDWQLVFTGRRILLLVCAFAALAAWMFRYDLKQDKNGNMVRLNRFSGEVATIAGAELVVAEKPRVPAKLAPSKPHTWNAVRIEDLGNLFVKVTTMWREDSLFYKVEVSPFSDQLRKAIEIPLTSAKLVVLFEDENEFEITAADIEMTTVTRLVDGKGGFSGIERRASIPLSFDAYSKISSINMRWSGFPARSASDCVLVRNWDVQDKPDRAVLVMSLANSCSQSFNLEGMVKLWDRDDRPIGDRRITIGEIAANESRNFEYVFKDSSSAPSIGGIKFIGLR